MKAIYDIRPAALGYDPKLINSPVLLPRKGQIKLMFKSRHDTDAYVEGTTHKVSQCLLNHGYAVKLEPEALEGQGVQNVD